ncbi:hypothetical protein K435DRAFT_156921 [Dendrothele bispora CBS 962.96]|uniref:Fungal-type protein kinase domain-containing protein n=1 Tax=Dendrothele bispora (strain CBS 962.96) TaxID=1314807 RepID=A0A4S8LY59_DENBC|nr:hypothetical protein K435DRAFT_156921 [Dendrothele bispora CBS 962.96]
MPWHSSIEKQFRLVDRNTTDESEYYGPYNTLLTYLFPFDEDYQISPQYKGPVFPGSIDFTTLFIVKVEKHPVFFIEIKPYPHLKNIGTRAAADIQMRESIEHLIGNLQIPTLYGLSCMGTRFAVYEYTAETRILEPEAIPRDRRLINDVAPETRWEYEMLETSGETRMKEIVQAVKAMCQALSNHQYHFTSHIALC